MRIEPMCVQSQSSWLPESLSFLSGLPEGKRRRRPLVILQAFVDESGTRNQDACFVMAGFISSAEEWAAFSDEWQACLDATPAIPYFKMRHAAGNPSGVFRNWRRDDVRKKVTGLVGILKRHARTAIHCTMPIALFDEIIGVEMAGFLKSPYSHTFYAMLAGIAWEAIDQKAERLELIFDEQDKYAQFIKNAYPLLKSKFDPELVAILPFEPMFRSDLDFLPIQAADMIAWLFRNAWNGKRTEWEWIATELEPVIPMSQYSTIYNSDRLRDIRRMGSEVTFTPEELVHVRKIWDLMTTKGRGPR
jgi:hypothetical protein